MIKRQLAASYYGPNLELSVSEKTSKIFPIKFIRNGKAREVSGFPTIKPVQVKRGALANTPPKEMAKRYSKKISIVLYGLTKSTKTRQHVIMA
jgi:hypothetical protein